MTGRDLIIYILENGLEDAPLVENGVLVGFETESAFAEKFKVGVSTVKAWESMGILEYITIGDVCYIPCFVKPAFKSGENNE